MSGPMADYRNGCLKMLEAMEEKDKYDLYEAKEWFGRVKVSTWQDVVAADTGVKEADKVPEVYFDAEFADSLLRHNFDFVPLDEISLMREVDGVGDADLLVMNKAVPAHGTLEFKAMGSGQCQLMLLSAQGAGLTLTVVETATGKEYAGKAIATSKASFATRFRTLLTAPLNNAPKTNKNAEMSKAINAHNLIKSRFA